MCVCVYRYGINDILRLNRIRDHRSMARNAYIERFGTNSQPLVSYIGGNIRYMGYNISSTDLYLNDKNYNIYTYTMSILERYDNYSFPLISNLGGSVHNTTAHPIPNGQIDFALKERCSHEPDVIIGELSRREKDKKVDVCSAVNGTSDRNNHNHSTRSVRMKQNEEQYELLQVPLVVRDLLNKLPEKLPPSVIAATPQQMDGFISYLKNVVLPPRPMTEMEVRSGGSALGPPPLPFSNQSSQVNGRQSNSNSVLLGSMGMDEEEDEAEASGQTQIELNSSSFGFGTDFQHTATYSDMNDINGTDLFRSRHKKKMLEN